MPTTTVYDMSDRMKLSIYDPDKDGIVNASNKIKTGSKEVTGAQARDHIDNSGIHLYNNTFLDGGLI